MKPEFGISLVAAVIFHALLLFGFRFDSGAHPLPASAEPSAVDVDLVEAAPAGPPEPPAPESSPEPAATPAPTPPPMPEPTPEPPPEPQATPPTPEPTPVLQPDAMPAPSVAPATPPPQHEKPRPRPRASATGRRQEAASHLPNAAVANGTGKGAGGNGTNTHALYRSNPRPEYPEDARRMRQEGLVVLSVEVGADGRVIDLSLKRSSGVNSLDEAAMHAVRRWLFEPARAAGIPVSSRVDVPVRFRLSDVYR